MDTAAITLVIRLCVGDDLETIRSPGMTEAQCQSLVEEIERPGAWAYCLVPARIWQEGNSYRLVIHQYVGGGPHETLRFSNLSKSVCKTWQAEEKAAGNSAYCSRAPDLRSRKLVSWRHYPARAEEDLV
jgi:hypothetical protein